MLPEKKRWAHLEPGKLVEDACNSSGWELMNTSNGLVLFGRKRMAFKKYLGAGADGLMEETKEKQRCKITPRLMVGLAGRMWYHYLRQRVWEKEMLCVAEEELQDPGL